jgi:hypothetical protein
MPSNRSLALTAAALTALPAVAAARPATDQPQVWTGSLVASFVGSLLGYLLVGGGLVVVGRRYGEATVAELRDDPAVALGWGLAAGVAAPIALAVLAVTIVGLVVAVPGFVVLLAVSVVGQGVTVLWVGSVLTGDRPDGRAALLGATVLAGVNAIPVVGGLVTTVAGLFGLGTVARRLYRSRRGGGRSSSRRRERDTLEDV